jgi:hypothetical protein
VQWTLAAKRGHPVMLDVLGRGLRQAKEVRIAEETGTRQAPNIVSDSLDEADPSLTGQDQASCAYFQTAFADPQHRRSSALPTRAIRRPPIHPLRPRPTSPNRRRYVSQSEMPLTSVSCRCIHFEPTRARGSKATTASSGMGESSR